MDRHSPRPSSFSPPWAWLPEYRHFLTLAGLNEALSRRCFMPLSNSTFQYSPDYGIDPILFLREPPLPSQPLRVVQPGKPAARNKSRHIDYIVVTGKSRYPKGPRLHGTLG